MAGRDEHNYAGRQRRGAWGHGDSISGVMMCAATAPTRRACVKGGSTWGTKMTRGGRTSQRGESVWCN
jgi:hypothetical protein